MYSIIVLKNVPRQLHVLSVVVKRVTGRKQTLCPLQRSNPIVASAQWERGICVGCLLMKKVFADVSTLLALITNLKGWFPL